MYIGFIIVGVVCFLIASFFYYGCCGVTIFSLQVPTSEMLGFFVFPSIPAAVGILIFWIAWKLYRANGTIGIHDEKFKLLEK
jgi:hypothetical protein